MSQIQAAAGQRPNAGQSQQPPDPKPKMANLRNAARLAASLKEQQAQQAQKGQLPRRRVATPEPPRDAGHRTTAAMQTPDFQQRAAQSPKAAEAATPTPPAAKPAPAPREQSLASGVVGQLAGKLRKGVNQAVTAMETAGFQQRAAQSPEAAAGQRDLDALRAARARRQRAMDARNARRDTVSQIGQGKEVEIDPAQRGAGRRGEAVRQMGGTPRYRPAAPNNDVARRVRAMHGLGDGDNRIGGTDYGPRLGPEDYERARAKRAAARETPEEYAQRVRDLRQMY
ncbi:MAG: hypothetical protein ACOCTI_04390, partial [Phycisphaeraceae bacterium]